MKKSLLVSTLLAIAVSSASAGGEGWLNDFEAAKKKAAEEKKGLLVDFTGSDWCGWCIKLNEEVFSHDEFKTGVADKFVLVEIDFPRDKTKLSEETKTQNEALQKKYSVRGFPTIFAMDAEGVPFAKTGYRPGGPDAYVAHLDELLTARDERDAAFAEAEKLESVEKANALVKGLSAMDDDLVASQYTDVIEQITTLDPKDETGYGAKMKLKAAIDGLSGKVATAMRSGNSSGILEMVDTFLAEHELDSGQKQNVLAFKINPLLQTKKFDEASAVLDAIIAVDPESENGKRAAGFKPQLEKMKEKAGATN